MDISTIVERLNKYSEMVTDQILGDGPVNLPEELWELVWHLEEKMVGGNPDPAFVGTANRLYQKIMDKQSGYRIEKGGFGQFCVLFLKGDLVDSARSRARYLSKLKAIHDSSKTEPSGQDSEAIYQSLRRCIRAFSGRARKVAALLFLSMEEAGEFLTQDELERLVSRSSGQTRHTVRQTEIAKILCVANATISRVKGECLQALESSGIHDLAV